MALRLHSKNKEQVLWILDNCLKYPDMYISLLKQKVEVFMGTLGRYINGYYWSSQLVDWNTPSINLLLPQIRYYDFDFW